MKNFDIIKHAVEANIPEPTLNIFKSFFENTNLIHGAENVIIQGISKSQCAYFILFYMIKHSDKRLRTSSLRDSWDLNCNFIDTLLDHVAEAIDEFIRQNLQKRSNTTLLEVARASTISPFSECVGVLDGMDVKVKYVPKDFTSMFSDTWKSIKFHYQNGVRFQMVVGYDLRCEWVDNGNAAGCHDLRCLWRSNFHDPFQNTNVLADNGYINSSYPVNLVTGYKKPINGELDEQQVVYNASHGFARSVVERFIGIFKSRFEMAMDGYVGPLRHFVRLIKLAIVLTNDTIRIAHNNFSDREEEIIADTIRTDAQHRPLDVFKLVNNSLSETMPEVIINPETSEHVLFWESVEEERRWGTRNRTTNSAFPTLSGQTQENARGSNRIERIPTVRPRPESNVQPPRNIARQ